jgi:hypothetical protein
VLKKHPAKPVTVFAVWEPMLPTDWSEPGPSVLMRLKDPKVRQYWDHDHSVAAMLKSQHPKCCTRDGFLWDIAMAYAPGDTWKSTLPSPFFIDGTIVDNSSALDALLAR